MCFPHLLSIDAISQIQPCLHRVGQAMLIGLPDRECRFEEADHAAEDAGLNGGVFVAGDTPVIHRALHDQDLLQCGVVTAVPFDGSSIAEGVSQKRH